MTLQGTWFYVWNLWNPSSKDLMPWGNAATLLDTLAPWMDKISGFCVKVSEGANAFNQVGGNDKHLMEWIETIREAGKQVEGWGYVYSDNPGPCGDRIEERREKLKLNKFLVDAEKEWNLPYGGNKKATLLMDKLHKGMDVALNSYRFPDYFPQFPFDAFCDHERNDFVVPQVYWLGRHNPVEQLLESYEQYRVITNKPFVPAGSAFGQTITYKDGSKVYWEPSLEDLNAMATTSLSQFGGVIWWSLDWIWTKQKWSWMDVICASVDPLPPPPVPQPGIVPLYQAQVLGDYINARGGPGVDYDDLGDYKKNSVLPIVEEDQSGEWGRAESWVYLPLLKRL